MSSHGHSHTHIHAGPRSGARSGTTRLSLMLMSANGRIALALGASACLLLMMIWAMR